MFGSEVTCYGHVGVRYFYPSAEVHTLHAEAPRNITAKRGRFGTLMLQLTGCCLAIVHGCRVIARCW